MKFWRQFNWANLAIFQKLKKSMISNIVKNTPLGVVFSTLFSVFGNVMKHCLSCLIYYVKHSYVCNEYIYMSHIQLEFNVF